MLLCSFCAFRRCIAVCRLEDEAQRYGRNKDTLVNNTYINSGEYRRKFDAISDNAKLNRMLYQLAKMMLMHRSGTLYEDMYWIDLDTLKVVAEETGDNFQSQIVYSKKTKEEILKHNNLMTIHSHPNSFLPSIEDINSNFEWGYSKGIVVCHNGEVYAYVAEEAITPAYYNMCIAKYAAQGYNENTAMKKAFEKLQEDFNIEVWEVKAMIHEYDVFEIPQEYLDMTEEELDKEIDRLYKEIKSQPPGPEKKKYTGKIKFNF